MDKMQRRKSIPLFFKEGEGRLLKNKCSFNDLIEFYHLETHN